MLKKIGAKFSAGINYLCNFENGKPNRLEYSGLIPWCVVQNALLVELRAFPYAFDQGISLHLLPKTISIRNIC